ncbi:membrane protein [Capnocytophaga sp. HP1101]
MKILNYISITIGLLGITACSSLDLPPEDYNGSGNFWKNEAQVRGAILGAHSQFRGHVFDYWLMGEVRGGTQIPSGTSSMDQNLYYTREKSQTFSEQYPNNSSWFDLYGRILNLNEAIIRIGEASFLSETNKNYYLGQAYGLRAWYYFWLYRTYGGVPINTDIKILEEAPKTADPLYTARSTPRATLDFIKSDISASENHFTASGRQSNFERSQWSYYATLMLKAEAYLWSAKVTTGDQAPGASDLATAKAALDIVMSSGQFALLSNFADVFAHNNKENREIIFTVAYLENEASTPFSSFLYYPSSFVGKYDENGNPFPNNDPLRIGSGFLFNEYKFELFQSYDAQDTRRDVTFLSYYSNAAKTQGRGLSLSKYLGFINSAGTRVFSSDIPIYRYADVLLMYAEIVNKEGGDPAQYINQIRQRAYGSNYSTAVAYTHTTFADGELAILHERDKEFVAEFKRWFDVRRLQDASGEPLVFSTTASYGTINGNVVPILNRATEAYKVLWPIDTGVMSHDKEVKQTPGYENTKG